MKIALPVENGFVNGHFGHSENFVVYTISPEREIVSVSQAPSPGGCGCKSGIAEILADLGVSVMLAGNIGAGAINHLNQYGIEVVRGCQGETTLAVNTYLSGGIIDNQQTCTAHEGCGNH
ncbi:MAG: NifB/NifX family molybdenum-iron cluster-binding protein [Bacteroidota bacterium]